MPNQSFITGNSISATIVNLDVDQSDPNIISTIPMMFVPKEFRWDATMNWSVIPTVGRNNPFYHYTGGEDTLQFTLDWLATDPRRIDAIRAATLLKSWGRNNGYKSEPPRIKIVWGGGIDLFANHVFIISKAPYRMNHFHGEQSGLPVQIYQDIELKKVTEYNELSVDISEEGKWLDFGNAIDGDEFLDPDFVQNANNTA